MVLEKSKNMVGRKRLHRESHCGWPAGRGTQPITANFQLLNLARKMPKERQ
jgi:hypothetical protein